MKIEVKITFDDLDEPLNVYFYNNKHKSFKGFTSFRFWDKRIEHSMNQITGFIKKELKQKIKQTKELA